MIQELIKEGAMKYERRKGNLTLWERVKAVFGWRAKCACGKTAYFVDDISGERRCTPCTARAEGKEALPYMHEYQGLRDGFGF